MVAPTSYLINHHPLILHSALCIKKEVTLQRSFLSDVKKANIDSYSAEW